MASKLTKIALAGLISLGVAGCSGDKEENPVHVRAIKGNENYGFGSVNFRYKNFIFFDEGFNGTLDRLEGYDSNGEFIQLSEGDEGFEDYIPLYIEAKRKATDIK